MWDTQEVKQVQAKGVQGEDQGMNSITETRDAFVLFLKELSGYNIRSRNVS